MSLVLIGYFEHDETTLVPVLQLRSCLKSKGNEYENRRGNGDSGGG